MPDLQRLLKIAKAGYRARTDDLLITNQLLYQLSYAGKRRNEFTAGGHGKQGLGRPRIRRKWFCRLEILDHGAEIDRLRIEQLIFCDLGAV